MDLYNKNDINQLFKKHGFYFCKSLGQNFLIDPQICPKIIAESKITNQVGVLEIGPGIGTLTVELAKVAKKVLAIEIDKRLIPILKETLNNYNNIKIINKDILKMDLQKLIFQEFRDLEVIICANIPYYITSPIIISLLENRLPIKSITMMLQQEVAEQLVAKPGTRNSSVLGLFVRYYSDPNILFYVPKTSFYPSPKVNSAIINIKVRSIPNIRLISEKLFFKVIKVAFINRRKKAINSIYNILKINKDDLIFIFNKLHINTLSRAENLTLT